MSGCLGHAKLLHSAPPADIGTDEIMATRNGPRELPRWTEREKLTH